MLQELNEWARAGVPLFAINFESGRSPHNRQLMIDSATSEGSEGWPVVGVFYIIYFWLLTEESVMVSRRTTSASHQPETEAH